jgi:hypothetical protein
MRPVQNRAQRRHNKVVAGPFLRPRMYQIHSLDIYFISLSLLVDRGGHQAASAILCGPRIGRHSVCGARVGGGEKRLETLIGTRLEKRLQTASRDASRDASRETYRDRSRGASRDASRDASWDASGESVETLLDEKLLENDIVRREYDAWMVRKSLFVFQCINRRP